jgi:hypothetical protein
VDDLDDVDGPDRGVPAARRSRLGHPEGAPRQLDAPPLGERGLEAGVVDGGAGAFLQPGPAQGGDRGHVPLVGDAYFDVSVSH